LQFSENIFTFIISLNDNQTLNREELTGDELGIVYASDLRDLINLLYASGAEGVAINNQRITTTTSINSVGNTILVDNFNLVPPFTISVIGDAETFSQYYTDSIMLEDLKTRIQNNGIEFGIEQLEFVSLPIYNGQLRLKHIHTTDEEI